MPPRESNKVSAGRASEFKQAQQKITTLASETRTTHSPQTPMTPQPGPGPKFVASPSLGKFSKDLNGNPYVFNPGGAAYNAVKGITDIGGRAVDDVANLASLGKNNSEYWDGSRGNSFAQSAANIAGLAAVALTGKVGGGAVKDPAVVAGAKIAKPINTATTIPSRKLRSKESVFPANFYPEGAVPNYIDPKKIDRTTGFYHGSASATPGPLTARGPQKQNLLTGDAFFTDTPAVAKDYTGGGTEGQAITPTWDKVYKAEGLQDKKVLDLYPQGPTLAQQDPKLFKQMLRDIKENAYPEDSVGDPNWSKKYDSNGVFEGDLYKGRKPYSQKQAAQWIDTIKATEGGFGSARHKGLTGPGGGYLYPDSTNGRFGILNEVNSRTGGVVADSALARGWDGFTHAGGQSAIGKQPHQVTALWDAKNTGLAKVPDADTTLPAVKPIREVQAPGSWKPNPISQQFSKMTSPKVKSIAANLGFSA